MPRQATITIKLDSALKKSVIALMKERGTTIETYVRLQLRAMTGDKAMLCLSDKMNFGKYYGEPVEDVVRANPGYIRWIITKAENGCKFGPDVLALLEEMP